MSKCHIVGNHMSRLNFYVPEASAAFLCKALIMLLLTHCLLLLALCLRFCLGSLFCDTLLSVLSSFAIIMILLKKRELVALF